MSVEISNTEITQTFDYWRNRTNELAWAMRKVVLTTDGSLSPSSLVANAVAEGNTRITGTFSANVFSANQNITANTSISVNTAVISPSTTTSFSLINATTISVGNVTENSVLTGSSLSTKGLFIASNVVINTISYFIGDSNSNTVISKESVLHRANTLVNSVSNSTTLRFSNDSVNSTLTFNSLIIGEAAVNSVGVFSGAGVFRANGTSLNANGVIANSSGVYANGLVNAANFTTTGSVNTATVFATGLVNAANFTTTGTVNTSTVFATGIVNASSFTTTGSVNTATVFATGLVNAASHTVGTSTIANSTGVYTGIVNGATIQVATDFTANSTLANVAAINVRNQTNTATLFVSTSANIASSNVVANTSGVFVTNSTGVVNAAVHSVGTSFVANSTGVYGGIVNGSLLQVGTSFTANSTLVNTAAINVTGAVNTATIYAVSSANIASAVQANSTGVWTTGIVNGASHTVGSSFVANSTGVYGGIVNGASHTVGSDFIANSTGVYHTGIVNAISHTTTGVTANVTGVYPTSNTSGSALGLSTNRWVVFANTVNASGLITGSSGADITGTTNTSIEFNVGSSFKANTTGVYHTGVVNSASHTVGTSTIANSTGIYTGIVNAASHTVGTSTIANATGVYTGIVNVASVNAGSIGTGTGGFSANTTTVLIGNDTINTVITSAGLNVNSATIANNTGVYTGIINAASHTVGTLTIANATGVYTGIVNGAILQVGSDFTANSTLVNAAAVNVRNRTNTATLFVTTTANVGANIQISTQDFVVTGNTTTQPTLTLVSNSTSSGLFVGNSSVTGAPTLNIANSAGDTVIRTTEISTSWGLSLNSTAAIIPGTLSATINTAAVSFGNSTVNTTINSTSFVTGNSSVTSTVNSITVSSGGTLSVAGIANLNGNTTVSGNWANVTGDMFVRGNLTVNGSLSYTGVSTADIVPDSNSYNLGSITKRWTLYSINIDNSQNTVSNNVMVTNIVNAASFSVGTSTVGNSTGYWTTGTVNSSILQTGNGFNVAGNGAYVNSTVIWIGNNSVSATINSTFYSKTANNTSFVGSVSAANVVSNAQLSANLSNYASLTGATFTGGVIVSNDVSISGNLTVTGTTLYANVTNLDVKDLNITVAKGAATATLTDGAGLTVDVSNIGWYYNFASNTWQSNVGITPSTNNAFNLGTTGLRWSGVFANNITLTNSVSAALISATNVSSTDLYGTVRTATQGTIDHNSLANYVADRHVAHSSIDIIAGSGLTGGGTIDASRTFDIGQGNGISVSADAIEVFANSGLVANATGVHVVAGNSQLISNSTGIWANQANFDHNSLANYDANRHIDHTAVSITAGNGLSGGGTIAATRTLNVSVGNNQLISNSTGIWANQANFDHNSLSNYDANRHVDHTAVSITAGNGLTGGGTIAATRTLSAQGANGISITAAGINVLAGNTQLISNSTGIWANQATFDHNSLTNYVSDQHVAHSSVSMSAGNGLTGGGTIAASRTFDVGQGNGISVSADAIAASGANGISVTSAGINVLVGNSQLISNSTGVWANQATFDHNSLSNYDANRHVDHTAVSITAGNGLTGGGTIDSSRTLNVLANTGIVSNSSGVFANATYIQSLVNISNGSVVTTGTSAQNVDSFLISSFNGAEYLISVSDNSANNRYVTKTLVMHDGSTAQITEYGSITSNNSVGVFSATQNATHIVLQFTPSLSATTVKFTRTVV